ncbi:oxidized low-density lipoprotein receptor 1 isoform X1 [Arvicanthis niloticus]|uniref:oxidized low-density lipoprotein receptor 1 isoform X1 n=1 Tax=Arvicanthis niloticus TaxID=61156 RepID=UPI001486A62A|nr:oxidized low-density lipoprotein receptor 1 isoform X1 [Arvicanthis niloticus]
MNLEMTFDDKMKPVNDQPDQKSYGKKPKGLHLPSSPWWCPAAMTLAILCLVLSVTLIVQWTQLLQASDLLKQYQANLTQQDHILEGQMLAQKKAENALQESKRELKEKIDTLTWKLNEKSKEQEELLQKNLNLQEALQRAVNSSEESQRELKGKIDTLTWKLNEKSKEQEELLQKNLNLQEALQRAVNSSEKSQRELKGKIDTLTWKLNEKSKEQEELLQKNLNLQDALQRAVNSSGPCPQDWLWHKENCYLFHGPLSWEKSRENCLSLDAQLLQINSADDLTFILQATSHSTSPFWMGLHRKKPNHPWLWENGSPLNFQFFRIRGISLQMQSSGSCAYLQQGAVFAENCILNAFSICQKKANLLRIQ